MVGTIEQTDQVEEGAFSHPRWADHRQHRALDDLEIELRAVPGALVIDSASTDANGAYWFTDVPPGDWEVKVSGDRSGDFDSVTYEFSFDADEISLTLPTLVILDSPASVVFEQAENRMHLEKALLAEMLGGLEIPLASYH